MSPWEFSLSGGIDSSTVAAFSARALAESGQRVQTFSVGFSSAEHDESPMARRVADHIGADHHELRVEDEGFDLELLDRIVDHVGQPLADVSCIPTYQVCKAAREEVKVVLSGDGGDELFGGYDHMFWAARVRRTGEQWPGFLAPHRYGPAGRGRPACPLEPGCQGPARAQGHGPDLPLSARNRCASCTRCGRARR